MTTRDRLDPACEQGRSGRTAPRASVTTWAYGSTAPMTDATLINGMTADLDLFIGAESCTCHATCICDVESDRLCGFLALLKWLGSQPGLLGPA